EACGLSRPLAAKRGAETSRWGNPGLVFGAWAKEQPSSPSCFCTALAERHAFGGASWQTCGRPGSAPWRSICRAMAHANRCANSPLRDLPATWRAPLPRADLNAPPVGHSLGGMLVQTLLRRRPDAYRAAVLACTSPAFGKPDGEWQRRFIASRLSPLDAGNTM